MKVLGHPLLKQVLIWLLVRGKTIMKEEITQVKKKNKEVWFRESQSFFSFWIAAWPIDLKHLPVIDWVSQNNFLAVGFAAGLQGISLNNLEEG